MGAPVNHSKRFASVSVFYLTHVPILIIVWIGPGFEERNNTVRQLFSNHDVREGRTSKPLQLLARLYLGIISVDKVVGNN